MGDRASPELRDRAPQLSSHCGREESVRWTSAESSVLVRLSRESGIALLKRGAIFAPLPNLEVGKYSTVIAIAPKTPGQRGPPTPA
jgi:hypothetical protein